MEMIDARDRGCVHERAGSSGERPASLPLMVTAADKDAPEASLQSSGGPSPSTPIMMMNAGSSSPPRTARVKAVPASRPDCEGWFLPGVETAVRLVSSLHGTMAAFHAQVRASVADRGVTAPNRSPQLCLEHTSCCQHVPEPQTWPRGTRKPPSQPRASRAAPEGSASWKWSDSSCRTSAACACPGSPRTAPAGSLQGLNPRPVIMRQ